MLAYLKVSEAPRNPIFMRSECASAKEWSFRNAAEAIVDSMLGKRFNETNDRRAG
jgi:hypothetical protein